MCWKKMPYWLKGGIIGGIISIISMILVNTTNLFFFSILNKIVYFPYYYIIKPIFFVNLDSSFIYITLIVWLTYLITFIFWFLIGAIIGFIIGKFKSSGKKRK